MARTTVKGLPKEIKEICARTLKIGDRLLVGEKPVRVAKVDNVLDLFPAYDLMSVSTDLGVMVVNRNEKVLRLQGNTLWVGIGADGKVAYESRP